MHIGYITQSFTEYTQSRTEFEFINKKPVSIRADRILKASFQIRFSLMDEHNSVVFI